MDNCIFRDNNCTQNECKNAEAYDNFFKNNTFVMLMIDSESLKITDANLSACRFYQYSYEEIMNLKIHDLIILPKEEIKAKIRMALDRVENTFYCKHRLAFGKLRDMEVHAGIIQMESKEYLHFTVHEITDSKLIQSQKELFNKANKDLQDTERRFDYLLDSTESIVFQVDKNGIYSLFKGGESIQEVDPSKVIGQSIFEIHKENIQSIENIKKALNGKQFRSEVSHAGYIHDVIYSPIKDYDNNTIGVYGIAINITAKKKKEMELAESEKRYKDLYNHMELGYSCYKIITDEEHNPIDYTFVEINPAYEKITGLARENLIGKKATEAFPNIKKSSVDWITLFGEVALTRKSVSMEVYSDIMRRWFSVNYFSPKFGYISSVFSDITKRVETEEELKHQKELLKIIVDNIPDPLSIYDKDDNLIQMNKARRKLYEEREIKDILFNPEKKYEFYDLEGNPIPLEEIPSRRALRGETVNGAIVVMRMPDREQITEVSAAPIFDKDNIVNYYVVIHRDITETVKTQNLIKNQQLQIIENEKEKNNTLNLSLQMKDEFISLISHELRTPLTIITATLQTLEIVCKNELPDKAIKYLDKIKQNSNRQLKLINNLLDNTRAISGHFRINKVNTDIIALTKKIIDSISPFAEKKGIQVILQTRLKNKIIGVDDELYERILLNLLSNAVKFTPTKQGKSIIVIVTELVMNKQEMIKIEVIDEGIGIPEDKTDIVFERFGQVNNIFSRYEEGTGIGLSLVKMLIDLMGGEIYLESKEGVGSTFTVMLPAAMEGSQKNSNGQKTEDRIIQATAIEFSDI